MIAPLLTTAIAGSLPPVDLREGTPLRIELTETIASTRAREGDTFGVRLAQAVTRDGCVLLPAGLTGTGEVIHAVHVKNGGRAGELILTVRYLSSGGTRIPVRGFRIVAVGEQLKGTTIVTGVAALPFRVGREVTVPQGVVAEGFVAAGMPVEPVDCDRNGGTE